MQANFSLPRIFALVGGLIFLLAAAVLGYCAHRASVAQLVLLTEENNVAVAATLSNMLERDRPSFLASAPGGSDAVREIDQAVRQAIAHSRVLGVKIYDRKGTILYATDAREIGTAAAAGSSFAVSAQAGGIRSTLGDSDEASQDVMGARILVTTYVPIRASDGLGQAGAFEIDADVTILAEKIRRGNLVMAGFIGAAFTATYLFLLFVVAAGSRLVARKHAETLQLAAAAAHAEAGNKQKSEFLVNMSHELRTPLNAILGFSDVIRNEVYGPASPPVYREYAAHIHGAGSHLLGIINDILDQLKANAGKLNVHVSETDLGGLMEAATALVQQTAVKAGVRLLSGDGRTLPLVRADRRKLKQVLINLLDNAVKFTPPGGTVTLEARQDDQAGLVEIIVTDTGIGIAAADMATCLEPFGQVDNALARKYQGTGLGLPLSKKFIELMGGTLSIDSTVGKGTRVVVRLPLHKSEQSARQLAA